VDNARAIWLGGDFFRTLGILPFLGQLISSTDHQPGCAGGVDLSYSFWQRRYGGAASVSGKTLTLEGHRFSIIGVTPPSFYGVSLGDRFDVPIPISAEPIIAGEYSRIKGKRAEVSWWLAGIGRLKPGTPWSVRRRSSRPSRLLRCTRPSHRSMMPRA
jgi:hypothetical protein